MNDRKWLLPLALTAGFIFILSLRQLSDPDLGFHLKYGKWIVQNLRFPSTDLSTYTVSDHPYVDLHWLFQVMLYGVYSLTGYPGLSLFVCSLTLLLSLLLLLRSRLNKVTLPVVSLLLLISFLIIDFRIAPRPELFSFLFLAAVIFLLDIRIDTGRNLLYLLPPLFLLWTNMHALFILGLIVLALYFLCGLMPGRTIDRPLLFWGTLSMLVCLVNPYGIKAFEFPIALLTRFDPRNIYNQHIQEFMPFFAQPGFFLRDYLFLGYLLLSFLLLFVDRKKTRLHEVILMVVFAFLAFNSIRNIPMFIVVAFPVASRSLSGLLQRCAVDTKAKAPLFALYLILILLPAALSLRLLTNSWYLNNNSFNKTGLGIDRSQQPADAASFLMKNHLDGRILNSLGFGGWLSWALPQPVFIDGRLEVMQEALYQEITSSWNGDLQGLIHRYKPSLIVYNYLKYYPWTFQLKDMPEWRLVYLDGIAAIFAHEGYAPEIKAIDLTSLPPKEHLVEPHPFLSWAEGFYKPVDYGQIDAMHRGLFHLQMRTVTKGTERTGQAALLFNQANDHYRRGDFTSALALYDSAIRVYPGYAKAYNNRGILKAFELKDYASAKKDFDKTLEIDPGNADAFLNRGTVNLYLKDAEAACYDWQQAMKLGNPKAARLLETYCRRK